MGEHYFSSNPNVESKQREIQAILRGEKFTFLTDTGVFSKADVDFGSRLLIETFAEPNVDGAILDVGCGYGPIGISLAKAFPQRTIEMVDVNMRALELAKINSKRNNTANVSIYKSDLYENAQGEKYAAILSNPPIRAGKKVVHKVLEESFIHLATGGTLWIVIQKKQGAPSAKEKLEDIFPEVEVMAKKKGYYVICAKKFDAD